MQSNLALLDPGDLLRQYRTRSGLTQLDLAVRASVSRPYISHLESGDRPYVPSREVVLALARVLDLSPEEHAKILTGYGYLPILEETFAILVARLSVAWQGLENPSPATRAVIPPS